MKTTEQAIAEYLAAGGKVTKCPPANAKGNEASRATREHVSRLRAAWNKENKE